MNFIPILIYFLFTYLSNCYCADKEIQSSEPSSSAYTSDSWQYLTIEKLESLFISQVTNASSGDPICSLPKIKKMVLCLNILDHLFFEAKIQIFLNLTAFLINNVDCEKKKVETIKKVFFNGMAVEQSMYPCYGKHYPVIRTHYRADDYYDLFYISTGPDPNSVFLYMYDYDFESDQYKTVIHSYYPYIPLIDLESIPITIQKVHNELFEENKEILITTDSYEKEKIYVEENYQIQQKYEMADWKLVKKISICKKVFEHHISKVQAGILLNTVAFDLFDPLYVTKKLKIHSYDRYETTSIWQKMLPCFGQKEEEPKVSIFSDYFKYFYISENYRDNSVFLYVKNETTDTNSEEFSIFAFIENINFTKLETETPPSKFETYDSIPSSFYLSKIDTIIKVRKYYLEKKYEFIESSAKGTVNIRTMLESRKRENDEEFKEIAENLKSSVQNEMSDIMKSQLTYEIDLVQIQLQKFCVFDKIKLLSQALVLGNQISKIAKNTEENAPLLKMIKDNEEVLLEGIQQGSEDEVLFNEVEI